ncbi:D-sedoheptulose 7-phosphate isomerase [bacterium]|nr:D-sedoheptulose 7-phosphate isomerase [bacterium]MCP5462426.1 D-sedoheptulose 7-phosphate isomerase [bacterium]
MKKHIESYLSNGVDLRAEIRNSYIDKIYDIAYAVYKTLKSGYKVYVCGNGGSAADAQHFAAEFVNRYLLERDPLPVIALTTDTSVITSIGNDYSFDEIFSKQIKAFAKKNDCVIAISTSGKSPNIINALKQAKNSSCVTISITGKDGGNMPQFSDYTFIVPSQCTPLIQEIHLTIEHLICDIVEQLLCNTAS